MSKVIVTFTTLPTRIVQDYDEGIKSNIASLLDQSYEDYEIHFNVPYIYKRTGEEYVIPQWISDLEGDKFKIFRVEDVGPVTKLYYTLQRVTDPDAIIIVCDDDLVYHRDMVLEQVRNQEKYVNTSVGYDGSRAENQSIFNDVRNHYVVSVPFDVEVNILQHYKTISYRRGWFDSDFDDFITKSWNDDILVAAYMGFKGIKKLVTTYEHEEKLITLEQWQQKGGVGTFPVLRHTSHEGAEGCYFYREIDSAEGYPEFLKLGYLK